MARAKSPRNKRHSKIRLASRGFKHARSRRIKVAKEALLHAGQYAYEGRKNKKRDLRRLWILRINAAVRECGLSYSKFMSLLKAEKIELDRKILSEIAIKDPDGFKKIVDEVKK